MGQLTRNESSVYRSASAHQFLLDQVTRWQKAAPGNSLRVLAQRLKISHTLLVMLIQGKRALRVKHASAIAEGFQLSSAERIYLQALIQSESAQTLEEKQLCQLWLAELHPSSSKTRTRVLDEFEVISSWIHMALLSLCELDDFDPKPESIARRFGGKVTATEVRSAIARLKALGLIQMEESGSFRPTQAQVTTQDDVLNQGARIYHKQVLDLGKDAIDRQSVQEREFQSFAISIDRKKIPLAKEMIRKFRAQFVQAMDSDSLDEVYQVSLQMFQLTESPAMRKQAEDEGVDGLRKNESKENVYV